MDINKQQPNPVVLVHGINDTGAVFNRMTLYLKQQGWSVHPLDLVPNNGAVGLDELAQQVADYVKATFPPEQQLDVIGFSMGGLVSRYYIQRLGGIARVKRFITIASPHNGTFTAYASWLPGCVQMRPNSSFLLDLNSDAETLKHLNFTSIWTPYDLMILPARSSQIPVGEEVILSVPLHSWMLKDSRSLAAVVEALRKAIRPYPQFGSTHNSQRLPLSDDNT